MATLLTTGVGNSVNILTSGSTSVLIAATAVQNPGTANSVTTAGINTNGANLIVVMAAYDSGFGGGFTTPTVNDNMGNGSYTALSRQNSALGNAGNLFYFSNPTVGAGHTITLTGTNTFAALVVGAFSNAVSSPFDVQNGGIGGPNVNPIGGTVTPSSNNALIVSGCTYGAAQATDATNITGAFNIAGHVQAASGLSYGGALAWWKQPTSSAANPQWTISLSDVWTCENAVFKGT